MLSLVEKFFEKSVIAEMPFFPRRFANVRAGMARPSLRWLGSAPNAAVPVLHFLFVSLTLNSGFLQILTLISSMCRNLGLVGFIWILAGFGIFSTSFVSLSEPALHPNLTLSLTRWPNAFAGVIMAVSAFFSVVAAFFTGFVTASSGFLIFFTALLAAFKT